MCHCSTIRRNMHLHSIKGNSHTLMEENKRFQCVLLFYKDMGLTNNKQVAPSSAHTLVLLEKAGG